MNISPVSTVIPNSHNSGTFKGRNDSGKSESRPLIPRENERNLAILGSVCLSGAVGLVATGLTLLLSKGVAKALMIGSSAGLLSGFLSWPEKDYNQVIDNQKVV